MSTPEQRLVTLALALDKLPRHEREGMLSLVLLGESIAPISYYADDIMKLESFKGSFDAVTKECSPERRETLARHFRILLDLWRSKKISLETLYRFVKDIKKVTAIPLLLASLGTVVSGCSGNHKGQLTFDYSGLTNKQPSMEAPNPSLNNLDK